MSIVGIRHSHRRVKAVSIMAEDLTAGLWQSEKDDAFLVRSLRHPKTILTLLGKGLTTMIERSFREVGDGMEITLTIPDDVAADIHNGSSIPLSRQLLELAAIQAHESDLITEREVMEMLGFEDREELYDFFKRYDVRSKHTSEDFERTGAALDDLLRHHHG